MTTQSPFLEDLHAMRGHLMRHFGAAEIQDLSPADTQTLYIASIKQEAAEERDCLQCKRIGTGMGPDHRGSRRCESGSLASGGRTAHCSCDVCF